MMLFAFIFDFLPATLAVGVGAISIPVIIHLINRRRFKIVPWAAMRFLLAAQKQTRKRMRIEQLLLLLVRMLIVATVLFAMASVMPWAEAIWSSPPAQAIFSFLGLSRTGSGQVARQQRIHHVMVLDASLSMNQVVEGGQTAFERARQLMLKKIQDGQAGDGYSVLILKDSPSWLVGQASQNTRKVMEEVEAVKPSHGNSALPVALNMVSAKLQEARGRFPTQAVYFFTDMQRSTWSAAASEVKADADGQEKAPYLAIQEMKAKCVFVDCGPVKDAGNLAVTDLTFSDAYVTAGPLVRLNATVQNFGSEAKNDLNVELLIGKARENANDAPLQLRVVDQENVHIEAGGRHTVKFTKLRFPAAGTYAVQVKIAGDALEQDNTRTVIITVRKTIPILLVNGKASADRFERATEYLRLVLNPFPAGDEPDWAPLRPRVVSPSEFTGMSEADLAGYDAIFWCDVKEFGVNDVRKLDAHLRRGGGFFVSLGDKAAESIERYNELLYKNEQGLLPAKLMKKIQAPPEHHFYFSNSAQDAYTVPPLDAFSDSADQLALRTARFRQFVQTIVPEGKARTILSFMPEVAGAVKGKLDTELPINAPALIEWQPPLAVGKIPQAAPVKGHKRVDRQPARYRGKVILLTSTVNMDWTSWPGSPSYGAMMHELTRLAVSGRLREQAQPVGVALEDYLPGGAEDEVTVNFPAGMPDAKPTRVRTQLIDDVNLFRFADTEFSGIYRVETGKGHELPFAVNVPTASADQHGTESDLSRYDEAKLKDLYPDWKFQIVRNPLEAQVAGNPDNVDNAQTVETKEPMGPWFANVSLLLLLALLFAEIVMAWVFGHYTTTEGALAAKPQSHTTTYVAAGIAIVSTLIFALGAFIVFRERQTGDFLGDLPDILRTWFENQIGVEPPQAGEGKNWNYETLPFLFGLPGGEHWWSILLSIGAIIGIIVIYRAEGPKVSLVFKMLLGALRLYLILMALWFLLPRGQIQYARLAYPDMAFLIDDTRSMGASDTLQDEKVIERVKHLSESIRQQLQQELPGRIDALENEIIRTKGNLEKGVDAKAEVDGLTQRLEYWKKQRDDLKDGKWRPSRLQLVQAILAQPEPHWLKTILTKYKTKIHIFHLDANGRATKLHDPKGGDAGEVFDPFDPRHLKVTGDAIAALEPIGNESRLGTALRQVMDHYRGSALSSVIMFTDGVTTRDETIAQASDYAAQKGIALFFVGVGDEHDQRKLELSDLQVEDQIYVGDTAVFEARVTGHGYKDLTVPVILKIRDKAGKEREVGREMIKVDPAGKSVKVRLRHQPKEVGSVPYIIEIEPPKLEPNEKPLPPGNLRLERTIEVIDTKLIKVLLVEGQPRYEFRYLKYLMERESPDKKKKKSIELKVLLLDADDDFAATDKTALRDFPPTLKDLNQYDVVILGDCDPTNKKLQNNLKDIASFVRGEDEKGKKGTKPGGGLLFIAGSTFNPHRYKGTPLADVMPVEPLTDKPPPEAAHMDKFNPELTPAGRMHPIFRFSPDESANHAIWQRLAPMFWFSTRYRIKPAAEILAVYPKKETAEFKDRDGDSRHPLVVQQFVGTGRSMFFGFDETWRWRKDDEAKFNSFWIQTMRYLSRGRSTRTDLRLDQQTPYPLGKPVKITVRFPDNTPGGANQPGPKLNEKTEVKVTVEYKPTGAKDAPREGAVETITLAKVEGSWGTYEGTLTRTRDGKYRFRLTNPDVSATQPDGEKPSAEAIVVLPPGELDNLRMNYQEMQQAAFKTRGQFHTVASADEVLDELPSGESVRVSTGMPPTLLWNQWWVFAIVLFMITSEWVLRKMKHLL